MKLSIIIPVYNEAATLAEIVRKVESVVIDGVDKEIVLVDDKSTDGSREWIERHAKKADVVVLLPKNRGKGGALKEGIANASGDVIVFQDADLEYDPIDFSTMIKPILQDKCQVVFGSRFAKKERHAADMYTIHRLGNSVLTFLFNLLYCTRLTDAEPCYKMFRADILKGMEVKADGFEYDIELMCKLRKKGYRICQMPISYNPRKFDEGKKITWVDGLKAAKVMLVQRFRP